MSSELDTVKIQVQQAANGINDAIEATQTAYSNADDKKERLNALGVHASYQGLEQACEKLQQAMATLGTAHGEATKVDSELQGVASTTPIPESLPKLGSAISELGTSKSSVDAAAELVRNAKTDAEQVGVEGIVAVCHGALDMIDTARSIIDTAANVVSEYQTRLQQEAQELDGLNTGASATTAGRSPASTPTRHADRPVSTRTTHGVTHGTVQRRAGIMEGPVIFSSFKDATPVETGQAQEYVDSANQVNREGDLSPTGRASLDRRTSMAKERAAQRERERAEKANEPYGDAVAAHLPDATWLGRAEPPGWGRHTKRLNSSLGGQSSKYPTGYKPTRFQLDDSWPNTD